MNKTVSITISEPTLVVQFPKPWKILSWAPYNGGSAITSSVINHQVEAFDEDEVGSILRKEIERLSLPSDTVGLLTGAEIRDYSEAYLRKGPYWVHAIATLGLSNARTVGDPADVSVNESSKAGTINLIVVCNALLGLEGRAEAIHIATMAKSLALLQAGVVSKKSGQPATGTGTDCIVIAASGEIDDNYCGMHTVLGELIGQSVMQVIETCLAKQKP